jgi:hypothetical protein
MATQSPHTEIDLEAAVLNLNSPVVSADVPDSFPLPAPPDSLCTQLHHIFSQNITKIKEYLTVAVIILILLGILYNFFARDEKDIPDDVFQKLYKVLGASGGNVPSIGAIGDGKWQQLQIEPKNNTDT